MRKPEPRAIFDRVLRRRMSRDDAFYKICEASQVFVLIPLIALTEQTIGIMWTAEYGDPEDAKHTANIHAWSPVHNVRKGVEYPSILVTTGDHDTRVVPGHSLKYLAQLQSE